MEIQPNMIYFPNLASGQSDIDDIMTLAYGKDDTK